MSHPYHHAVSTAKRWGGEPEDYLDVHSFFDQTKSAMPDFRHRAVLHNAFGIFLAEQVFGPTITNSAGRVVPTRLIGEQHVIEDCGRIPSVEDWMRHLAPQPWMNRPRPLSRELEQSTNG